MNNKRMLRALVSLSENATLAFNACVAFSPAYAAGGTTVYTFGDASVPFRDLAKEHENEKKQREKERKKAAQKQAMQEKAAMRKAAREARERERKEKAAKNGAEKKGDE